MISQLAGKLIVGPQEPAELTDYLRDGHERLRAPDRDQLGDGMPMDRDAQMLAALHPAQEGGRVVAQLPLRDIRRHMATS